VIKVRYQTPEFAGRYAGTFSALGTSGRSENQLDWKWKMMLTDVGAIVREEKVQGLFKGVTSPMVNLPVFSLSWLLDWLTMSRRE
jgi:solute carrier family 25 carnitine/acylcarnitine transporter 20/29